LFSIQLEKADDSEAPNPDETGHVWVMPVFLNERADKLYLCTDGGFR
jgi:hypothetical protein